MPGNKRSPAERDWVALGDGNVGVAEFGVCIAVARRSSASSRNLRSQRGALVSPATVHAMDGTFADGGAKIEAEFCAPSSNVLSRMLVDITTGRLADASQRECCPEEQRATRELLYRGSGFGVWGLKAVGRSVRGHKTYRTTLAARLLWRSASVRQLVLAKFTGRFWVSRSSTLTDCPAARST